MRKKSAAIILIMMVAFWAFADRRVNEDIFLCR